LVRASQVGECFLSNRYLNKESDSANSADGDKPIIVMKFGSQTAIIFEQKTWKTKRRRRIRFGMVWERRREGKSTTKKGTSQTIAFQSSLKIEDAFERLRNMLELEIRCRYSLAPELQVGTSITPSACDGFSTGEEVQEGSTLTLCSRDPYEYRYLISSSSRFLSLSNGSADFEEDLKFYVRRGSLVSGREKERAEERRGPSG